MVGMANAKYVITTVLLLATLMAATQTVQSQQYATTTATSFATSTITIGTQVVAMTQGQSSPIFSGQVTIPGSHGVCGVYFVQAFNSTAGETLVGSVTASSSVDVYVMTAASFQAWSHQIVAGGVCTPASLVASQRNTTAYSFTPTIPTSGLYDVVVNNLSHSSVNAQVTLTLATSAPSLVTTTAFSTVTQQFLQTMTQTSTSTQAASSGGPDLTTTLVGILVVIILVAIGFMAMKRRKPAKK